MFKNVGRELKDVAEGMAWRIMVKYGFGGVLLLLLSILFTVQFESFVYLFVGVIASVLVFLFGRDKAKLSVMELYAYDELVECAALINQKLPELNPDMSSNESGSAGSG